MFGLLERDLYYIKKAIDKFDEIDKAIVFGSRAMGNYKKGSDIDLAIVGENLSKQTIYRLDDYLNDVYPIPYFFDIINYQTILNKKLKEHVDNEGKIIYIRKTQHQ